MSLFQIPDDSVVTRLRAAGCVFAEDEARLLRAAARTPDELAAMVARRVAGLPLEHVLGWAEFRGLRIAVEPGVFVPRRRTEFLVEQALDLLRAAATTQRPAISRPDAGDPYAGDRRSTTGRQSAEGRPPADAPASGRLVLVDLCCGSGAVGVALAVALAVARAGGDQAVNGTPTVDHGQSLDDSQSFHDARQRAGGGGTTDGIELHAVDLDPVAVRCARRNLAAAGGRVHQGDLYQPLPPTLRGRIHLLVANAPYVPSDAVGLMPAEARIHEPRLALDGGADGLDVLRRVVAAAPGWLAPGGHLLVETSGRQAPRLVDAVAASGLVPRVTGDEDRGATVVIGSRPAQGSKRPTRTTPTAR
jgi:release factor glutamine methyltransferase